MGIKVLKCVAKFCARETVQICLFQRLEKQMWTHWRENTFCYVIIISFSTRIAQYPSGSIVCFCKYYYLSLFSTSKSFNGMVSREFIAHWWNHTFCTAEKCRLCVNAKLDCLNLRANVNRNLSNSHGSHKQNKNQFFFITWCSCYVLKWFVLH